MSLFVVCKPSHHACVVFQAKESIHLILIKCAVLVRESLKGELVSLSAR